MSRGSSLIDVVVGSALMLMVFMGLFGIVHLATQTVGLGKARTGALALANEQVEYIRSLPYSGVAVVGGIPAGSLPAEETIVLNNISYTRRTFVQFIDDAADGVGAADANSIQADYKVAKVSVAWNIRGSERDLALVTNIVPKGIETLDGGGTLALNVIDAAGLPVSGATLEIVNTGIDPDISIETFSNVDGAAYFPGAPQSTAYEVVVSKVGYSTDQTYTASLANPNPLQGTLTVVDDTITSATFRIDLLADLTVRSFDETRSATWTDLFSDTTFVETNSNTEVNGGAVVLIGGAGAYASQGSLVSVVLAPDQLDVWTEVIFDTSTPPLTTASVQVYYTTATTSAIVPDAALAGNSVGFTSSPIDISTIPPNQYPSLALVATLETNDPLVTSSLSAWSIVYEEGPVPRPDTSFTIRGTKTIGTDGGGLPIYKYDDTFTTDAEGEFLLEGMEWDVYEILPGAAESGLSIVEMCPFELGLNPGIDQTLDIIFTPASVHSLRVYVTDENGAPLEDASATLSRTGYTETSETSACGQTYFREITPGTYTLDVSASGYSAQNDIPLTISGATVHEVLLNL